MYYRRIHHVRYEGEWNALPISYNWGKPSFWLTPDLVCHTQPSRSCTSAESRSHGCGRKMARGLQQFLIAARHVNASCSSRTRKTKACVLPWTPGMMPLLLFPLKPQRKRCRCAGFHLSRKYPLRVSTTVHSLSRNGRISS